MTTLHDLTLKVAREITEVMDGTATASAATSITDTNNLTQQAGYWDRGTVWIRSGVHIGKNAVITGYAANKITFPTFGTDVATPRYSVARSIFPYRTLAQSVNSALDEVRVKNEDDTLIGDGESLTFVLPAGVSNIVSVQFEDITYVNYTTPSHHWKEINGELRFDYGYPPPDTNVIHLYYLDYHPTLTTYSDTVHEDVNTEWLKWKACEHALYWALKQYPDAQEYRIEETMNKVIQRLQSLTPVPVVFKLRTAGA